MYTIVGGDRIISVEKYILSLVRHKRGEHAFLILEGVEGEERVAIKAELVIEQAGDKVGKVNRADLDIERLEDSQADLCYHRWQLNKEQVTQFSQIVEDEMARSQRKEIPYVTFGQTPASGAVGNILASQSPSEGSSSSSSSGWWSSRCIPDACVASNDIASKASQSTSRSASSSLFGGGKLKSVEASQYSLWVSHGSVDALLRPAGHNCLTWAIAVAGRLGLSAPPVEEKWTNLFLAKPSDYLKHRH